MDPCAGVAPAPAFTCLPLAGKGGVLNFKTPVPPPAAPGEKMETQYRVASSKYFQTMNIPLLKGRYFTNSDDLSTPGVAIINQAMARRYFPNEDPIGKRVGFGGGPFWCEIVGIVGNVRHYKLADDPKPEVY